MFFVSIRNITFALIALLSIPAFACENTERMAPTNSTFLIQRNDEGQLSHILIVSGGNKEIFPAVIQSFKDAGWKHEQPLSWNRPILQCEARIYRKGDYAKISCLKSYMSQEVSVSGECFMNHETGALVTDCVRPKIIEVAGQVLKAYEFLYERNDTQPKKEVFRATANH